MCTASFSFFLPASLAPADSSCSCFVVFTLFILLFFPLRLCSVPDSSLLFFLPLFLSLACLPLPQYSPIKSSVAPPSRTFIFFIFFRPNHSSFLPPFRCLTSEPLHVLFFIAFLSPRLLASFPSLLRLSFTSLFPPFSPSLPPAGQV